MTLKAFHNDEAIKQKYVDRVIAHQKADNLIRGKGWDEGKGCAVGCTLENYDHSLYPIEMGIPAWIAHVEDRLFEGMSLEKSKTFPEIFLKSINVGADLEKVKKPFLLVVLRSCLDSLAKVESSGIVDKAKESILMIIEAIKKDDDKLLKGAAADAAADAAYAAAYAAYSAAAAAAYAAYSAAAAAAAAYAAYSAAAAAYAAYAAASAAADAAYATRAYATRAYAADAYAFDYFADELIKILKEC